METPLVVDPLNEASDVAPRLIQVPKFLAIHLLIFQGLPEAFGQRIVVRIAFTRHAAADLMPSEYLYIFLGAVLYPAVGVMNQALLHLAPAQRFLQGAHT